MTETQAQVNAETAAEEITEPVEVKAANDVSPAARVEELEKQVTDLKDQVLRSLADAENTRRRAQKEREDTSKYAVSGFAREMLNVADNFRRALEATPKDSNDEALKNLIAGIDATERQLLATLDRFGIKKMEPLGQPFDPNFHRVMIEVEDAEKPAGTVVQVLQSGYVIHDRLLREALVSVSKGGQATQSRVDTSA